jgi:hypothetical protein
LCSLTAAPIAAKSFMTLRFRGKTGELLVARAFFRSLEMQAQFWHHNAG